ncbi:G protein-activated inward rectifier potassium channel 2 isoform X2 [Eurytemora carolleeae]|uniref:G protein-activated inward rectifier potassium channel 2 isoform X2 n=1 Tax=Eurytemora carolleeae TaxID=1294199 RepID=UPI000C776C29|nr:G protein-activated inward rectifier potassium channel 2 isoform X2 [Eurytemora carolleeae]|eukprot:XP_023326137.1 G protein-activated inward rectifier potassium channel 2-like isoform X2 [Eurytemora affinis]
MNQRFCNAFSPMREAILAFSPIRRQRNKEERRLIDKDGTLKIAHHGLNERKTRYIDDIFTTCVDLRWRYIFLGFTSSFLVSWLTFAGIWHLLFYLNGDLEEDHLPDVQVENGWTPCVYSIYDFGSTFLFSVETQHTIGYGLRGSSHKCPDTIILQCIQSIAGVLIQACMAGIVFAKLARPKNRARTVTFSKNAVVSMVNGKLRLMFRVANARNSQILEAHYRALLLGNFTTKEGSTYRNFPTELPLTTQIQEDEDAERKQEYGHVFLPLLVCHTIDRNSPLYNITPAQLLQSKVELLITLEGIVEQSGNTVQARTSFLPSEILWGHTFTNCVTFANKEGVYLVDHSKMDGVQADETPRLSAKQLENLDLESSLAEKFGSKYASNNKTLTR